MTTKPRELLRMPAVRQRLGDVSADTVYRAMKNEGFPQPLKLTRRVSLWDAAEVNAWLENRMASRASICDVLRRSAVDSGL